jgi:hypothetical protein
VHYVRPVNFSLGSFFTVGYMSPFEVNLSQDQQATVGSCQGETWRLVCTGPHELPENRTLLRNITAS